MTSIKFFLKRTSPSSSTNDEALDKALEFVLRDKSITTRTQEQVIIKLSGQNLCVISAQFTSSLRNRVHNQVLQTRS